VLRLAPTLMDIFKEWVSSHLWIESEVNRFETFGNHIIIIIMYSQKKQSWIGHVCIIQLQHLSLLEVTTLDSDELNEIRSNEWVEKPKTFRAQAPPPPPIIGDTSFLHKCLQVLLLSPNSKCSINQVHFGGGHIRLTISVKGWWVLSKVLVG
jgi:hypothetical protein